MFQLKAVFAAALLALATSPAFSAPTPAPCAACGKGAPGPIAGAGLGFLALAGGGYYLFSRWRKRNTED